jgi:S-formylglutathione hydrolase FrmB
MIHYHIPMSMMRTAFLLILFTCRAASQVTVVEDSLFSVSLNKISRYMVVLPNGYSSGQERYPVLYLLHGLGGDHTNWVKKTGLVRYAADHRLIIVTPDGGDGWYSNSTLLPNARYEDHIMNDVIPGVEARYRTLQTRYHRSVAGLSMGGYGAFLLALKYPAKFFFAGGISPSMQFPAALEDSAIVSRWSKASISNLRALFGVRHTPAWDDQNVMLLAQRSNGSTLPYFFLSTGSQDVILEIVGQAHDLAGILRSRGASFEMHELPGKHDWSFWDQEVKAVLQRITALSGKGGAR